MPVRVRNETSARAFFPKTPRRWLAVAAAGAVIAGASPGPAQVEAARPPLVPTPKSLLIEQGSMPLTATSRVVAGDPSLAPLAAVLSEEIAALTGLKLAAAQGRVGKGDIGLKINPALRADADILAVQNQKVGTTRDFAHTITVGDSALVEGWNYRAVAEGTATILQAITAQGGAFALPRMKVKDWPYADYTGVMVDVARQRIPADALEAVIEACRLWKIRYCQLHLTDDEAFTFPSAAYPKLGTKNKAMHKGAVPLVYGLKELQDLVAYADARGVTLVPELETPGHSEAMARALPEVFGTAKMMNIASDEVYKVLDTLVGEMCDVFKSSPYFHIGGEEIYHWEFMERPETKAYMERAGLKSLDELLVQHQLKMSAMIRKRGKMTLAWERGETGTAIDPEKMKDDFVLMCWYPWPTSANLQKMGFTTITVPWEPGAPRDWNLFVCNQCTLSPTNRVLGASQTMWHMSASALVGDYLGGELNGSTCEGYIRSLGIRAERTWGPDNPVDEAAFQKRLAATRAILERMAFPVRIDATGIAYAAWPVLGRQYCGDVVEARLSATNAAAGGEIRYTLDGSEPTVESPVYAAPIVIEDAGPLHAALFRDGQQIGHVTRAFYEPIDSGGAITKWMICGPFTQEGKTAFDIFDVAFEPETTGKGDWKAIDGGHLKISDIPGFGGNSRAAYLRASLWSPAAQKALLFVTSDDGVKVLLNGETVHGANVARPPFVADQVSISLRQGWNKLLIKAMNVDGGWECGVRIRNADGGRLAKLRIKAE